MLHVIKLLTDLACNIFVVMVILTLFYNILVITLIWLYSSVLNSYLLKARPTYEPLFFAHVGQFVRFVIDPYLYYYL